MTAKERVELELKELKEKFNKLANFIGTEKYYRLEEPQRKWLHIQKMHMEGYINALEARLELWEEVK